MFVYRVEKSKLSKCLAPLVLLTFEFLQDFRGIVYYQKTVDACVTGDSITVLLKMFGN